MITFNCAVAGSCVEEDYVVLVVICAVFEDYVVHSLDCVARMAFHEVIAHIAPRHAAYECHGVAVCLEEISEMRAIAGLGCGLVASGHGGAHGHDLEFHAVVDAARLEYCRRGGGESAECS